MSNGNGNGKLKLMRLDSKLVISGFEQKKKDLSNFHDKTSEPELDSRFRDVKDVKDMEPLLLFHTVLSRDASWEQLQDTMQDITVTEDSLAQDRPWQDNLGQDRTGEDSLEGQDRRGQDNQDTGRSKRR